MNKSKIIGIVGFKNSEGMFGVTGNYMQFASKYGNVRIIMPHEEFVEVDLLLLPGGADLTPTSYGQIPGYKTGNPDVFKEFFFEHRLRNYVGNTPIFGICLGFQMLNVHFGGSLTQHLNFHPQSSGRWSKAHDVFLSTKDKKGEHIKFEVNSHHHQAVKPKNLSKELQAVAWAAEGEKGLIVECFVHKELPIAGVQWHPEECYDEYSDTIIKNLLATTNKEEVPVQESPEIS